MALPTTLEQEAYVFGLIKDFTLKDHVNEEAPKGAELEHDFSCEELQKNVPSSGRGHMLLEIQHKVKTGHEWEGRHLVYKTKTGFHRIDHQTCCDKK